MNYMDEQYKNISTEQKNSEIEKAPVKKNRAIIFPVIILFAVLIIVLNKDAIYSEYNKFMTKESVNEDNPAEKKEEPKKEEYNYFNDRYFDKIDKADDAKRKTDLINIRLALEFYSSENGGYPISMNAVKLNDANSSAYKALIKYTSSSSLKDPKDPDFFYLYKSDGKSFEISARLENDKDPDCVISSEGFCIYKISSASK